jgi:hypothetical protein
MIIWPALIFKRHINGGITYKSHLQQHSENSAPNNERQEKQTQSRKRKLSTENEQPSISTEKIFKKAVDVEKPCNWCSKKKALLPGKSFCVNCGQQGRECKGCHRPLPKRFLKYEK